MVQYKLIRSKKRRRSVAMHIDQAGVLVVRAPVLMPQFIIDRFVRTHESWVEKQKRLRSVPQPKLIPHFANKTDLEQYIQKQIHYYSGVTDLHPSRIRFRSVRTYWGSCSPQGIISFNDHLQYVPKAAIDYVVVHELCHLRYRGHGKRFWQLVEKYFPRANEMRRVLRQIPRGDT